MVGHRRDLLERERLDRVGLRSVRQAQHQTRQRQRDPGGLRQGAQLLPDDRSLAFGLPPVVGVRRGGERRAADDLRPGARRGRGRPRRGPPSPCAKEGPRRRSSDRSRRAPGRRPTARRPACRRSPSRGGGRDPCPRASRAPSGRARRASRDASRKKIANGLVLDAVDEKVESAPRRLEASQSRIAEDGAEQAGARPRRRPPKARKIGVLVGDEMGPDDRP